MSVAQMFVTFVVTSTIMLSGCTEENAISGKSPVKFTSDIDTNENITRISGELGDVWDKDDEIGIYMYQSNVTDGTNARYLYTGADGKFEPSGEDLYYPGGGSNVNFMAYYPWLATLHTTSSNVYPINVADQSKNIDLMFAPVKTQSEGTVNLRFSHQLSRLIFLVTDVTNANLAGMTAVINGMPTTAKFDLAAASPIVANQGNVAPIPVKLVSASGNKSRVEAVVLPGTNIDYTMSLKLADGSTAEFEMKGKNFVSGKQYKYEVMLDVAAEIAHVSSESIEGWGAGNENGEDVGTKKDPQIISVFKGKNLVTFGNSITISSNSWAYQTYTRLKFDNLYNGAFGGARWYKTKWIIEGQVVETQDYDDPDFAGMSNVKDENQEIVNNCAIVHIQKYLAERGDRVPDFIILSYGTNDRYDTSALGDPEAVLQENDLDKLDLFTIPGALKWSLATLKTNFPSAKIYVALPLQVKNNDRNEGNKAKIMVIKTICDRLSIPYFDCFNESGITQANIDQYTSDGLHPNEIGKTLHADYIIRQLKAAHK